MEKAQKVIDIAAADAGAVAGSYGSATLLPLGVTYTHMRVTIDRKFTVITCRQLTDFTGVTAALQYNRRCFLVHHILGGSLSSNPENLLMRLPVEDDGQTASRSMNVYLKNDQIQNLYSIQIARSVVS